MSDRVVLAVGGGPDVRAAVEAKIAGQDIVVAEEAPRAQIIDLFEALKKSIAEAKKPGAKASAEEEPAAVEGAKPAPQQCLSHAVVLLLVRSVTFCRGPVAPGHVISIGDQGHLTNTRLVVDCGA